MKKIVLIVVLIVSTLSACKANNKEQNNSKDKITMKVIELTKADFLTKISNFETSAEWKYLGDKPALIDFYATWCGPCKAIAPVLEELAAEYGEEIYIYKIDTEKEQELAALFGIRSIPSLLFIPMDKQPQMAQGAVPKQELKKAIDDILLNK